ncbi:MULTISPECIES: hypothetical protein [unclassified Ensifer]|uniref:hypothetical protein n=1 Tax=unclassified Ensifer TaxID=2633371 RepID=UPI000713B286|nr:MULTISPECIES: hypothetical protein [unclassified Ensifer]KQX58190.1 hypothetical protein ASD49_18945 [Ensifer sp. Root1298]KQX84193.1 hypothetical protein ASD41_31985 [Ensifer sp. Root1312]KRC22364.1 hypothetical protein ASE29_29785 [Ensifer sp. Root74]KRD56810.1 hypothetical protein ASE71_13835 [Ensifer sp. Root954]
MTDEPHDRDILSLCDDSLPKETRPNAEFALKTPSLATQREQLDVLRADVARLRERLIAIADGTSRLAVLEATVVLETVEGRIRRHLAPVLFTAGVAGYIWSAFLRRR